MNSNNLACPFCGAALPSMINFRTALRNMRDVANDLSNCITEINHQRSDNPNPIKMLTAYSSAFNAQANAKAVIEKYKDLLGEETQTTGVACQGFRPESEGHCAEEGCSGCYYVKVCAVKDTGPTL